MGFEEIEAGYMPEYIIKEGNVGNKVIYKVYCHYPTTEPDVFVFTFDHKANAEIFCKALNAENRNKEADLVKRGSWEDVGFKDFQCSECGIVLGGAYCYVYCPHCGTKML